MVRSIIVKVNQQKVEGQRREGHTISSTIENLRSKILRSSAESVCGIIVFHVQLTKTEVTESDVAGIIQKNIFRFKITGYVDQQVINILDQTHR